MRFPLFRKENSTAAQRERQEQMEKLLADGLRNLSSVLTKLADLVERQRLSRAGFEKPDKFLQRHDSSTSKPPEPPR